MAINLGKTESSYEEIILNEHGDSTFISADDSTLFDRFVNGYKKIVSKSEEVPKKLDEIEKKYEGEDGFSADIEKAVEMSEINVKFSEDAVEIIDSIFGDGTVKKYFRNLYEKIPTFTPSVDCFIEFMENITPEMEKLFDRKIEERDKLSKARMAKYQPQDHKRKSRT